MSGRIILGLAVLVIIIPVVYGFYLVLQKVDGVSEQVRAVHYELTVKPTPIDEPTATPSATPTPTLGVFKRVITPTGSSN